MAHTNLLPLPRPRQRGYAWAWKYELLLLGRQKPVASPLHPALELGWIDDIWLSERALGVE